MFTLRLCIYLQENTYKYKQIRNKSQNYLLTGESQAPSALNAMVTAIIRVLPSY